MVGPQLSRRQMPYFAMALGMLLIGLALAAFFLSGSSIDWVTVFLGVEGGAFVGVSGYYAWRHSRVPRGSREYEDLDRGRVRHRPNEDQVAFGLGIGSTIAGILVLGVVEGPEGRCYRGAPNACLFSWSPSNGWEFVGTFLFFGGLVAFAAYVVYRIGRWQWERRHDR
jgi:hypothetical protein